ncbi:cancer-related nucleoside-triphosphatase homolog [Tubulanus polymorphus]|uniref:cancer-related nucleoside-triphosphatase homolog n=1 Tax=Tubulanus polymorphus TaxID=672921 RepID=UPI003DA31537
MAEASVEPVYKHVVLRGKPGIGKTTLIMNVYKMLVNEGIPCQGFVTEEVRQNGVRSGFDIVTLDGLKGPLARVSEETVGHSYKREYKVGKYSVDVTSLEQIALPSLHVQNLRAYPIFIIDEIGKMESFSQSFLHVVQQLFQLEGVTILATVPIIQGRPHRFVDELTQRKDTKLFYVSRDNRESLVQEVCETLYMARNMAMETVTFAS